MKCLKCLNPINKGKEVNVNQHLTEVANNWGLCKACYNDDNGYGKDYYYNNKDRYRELHKGYKSELTDSYVANCLVDKTNLKAKDIPQEMVVAKRQFMKMNRIIKEK